jgi:hypothetical protein
MISPLVAVFGMVGAPEAATGPKRGRYRGVRIREEFVRSGSGKVIAMRISSRRGITRQAPRFHPRITQEVGAKESQREPKALRREALIYDGFVCAA